MRELVDTIQSWFAIPIVGKIVQVIFGLIILVVAIRFLKSFVSGMIKDNSTRYKSAKALSFLQYIVGIIYVLSIFSNSFGQLTLIVGGVGAGIAFALQEVIASFAGWVAISLGNFYKPGDRIQLGGIRGDVIDIDILRTTLMELGDWVNGDLYNGRIVRVANSFVFKEPVFNYSSDFPFLWDEIIVPIRYGSDRKLTRKVFEQIAEEVTGEYITLARDEWKKMLLKYRIEDAKVESSITLIANDNWLEFTIRYVVDFKKRRITKDKLFTRILDEIDNSEGRIKTASATFELVDAPIVRVQLDQKDSP